MEKGRVFVVQVHLLNLDGNLSVHTSRERAIMHYKTTWALSMLDGLDARITNATLSVFTKQYMRHVIFGDLFPIYDIKFEFVDFEDYLEECEDVCHYQQLEMTGNIDLQFK